MNSSLLPLPLAPSADPHEPEAERAGRAGADALEDTERAHVLAILARTGGSQQEAARLLGIGRTTLWRKLKGWGIAAAGPGPRP